MSATKCSPPPPPFKGGEAQPNPKPQTKEGAPSRKTLMASGAGLLGNQDLTLTGGGAGVPSEEAAMVPPSQAAPPMDVSPISSAAGAGAHPAAGVREQDRFMPIANVIRIMRRVLPAHAKIADDAKEMIQECVSEYISFITSEANERCQREQRKTVTAEDVLWAMNKLGFDDYIEPLTLFLHRYREIEGDHRGSLRADAIHIIKHRNSSANNNSGNAPPPSAGAEQFFATAPLPPPSFVMPPPAPQQPPQHLNLLSESMVSYFLNMYGSGEGPSGSGGGYGNQVTGMPNFDHPFPPPPPPPPSYK